VARELERAEARSKPILPLLLIGEPFESLRGLQYESVADSQKPSRRFIGRLRALTQSSSSAKPLTALAAERAAAAFTELARAI
jgi:hypothetical protein